MTEGNLVEGTEILKRIDYIEMLEDAKRRFTGITVSNLEGIFLVDEKKETRTIEEHQIQFNDIVFPDSIGHRIKYKAGFIKNDSGSLLMTYQCIHDEQLNRYYFFRKLSR